MTRPSLAVRLVSGLFLVIVVLSAALAPGAGAHSSLITSSPAPGQTVGGSLPAIDMVFDAGLSEITAGIEAPDGEFLAVEVKQPSPNWIRIEIDTPQLAGQYIVRFSFLSDDGDPVESAFAFSYDELEPEAIPVSQSTAVLVSTDGDDATPLASALTIGLALTVLLLAALLVMRLRQLRVARTVADGAP